MIKWISRVSLTMIALLFGGAPVAVPITEYSGDGNDELVASVAPGAVTGFGRGVFVAGVAPSDDAARDRRPIPIVMSLQRRAGNHGESTRGYGPSVNGDVSVAIAP